MSGRFCHSFNDVSATTLSTKWTIASGSPTIDSGTGPFGSNRLNLPGGAAVQRTFDNQATWCIGFYVNFDSFSAAAFCAMIDVSTTQIDLRVNADGTLTVTRNGTVLGTSTTALTTGTEYHIQFKGTINNTTGIVTVKINDAAAITLTSQNTRATANNSANVIKFSGVGSSSIHTHISHVYICDGQGTANNDLLGIKRVQCTFPTGAGASTQFTPTGAASNWQCVDETAEDGDTTYVSSATAGQIDLYTHGSLAASTSSIAFAMVTMVARADDANTRTIAREIRSGTTNFAGTNQNLSSSYTGYFQIDENDPNTSAPWTVTNANNAQIGVQEVA